MTHAAIALTYTNSPAWFLTEPYGVSPDAGKLRNVLSRCNEEYAFPASRQKELDSIRASFKELSETVSEAMYFTDEFEIPSELTLNEASRLLATIPSSFPRPAILIEPSGAIAFEWYRSPKNIFLLSSSGRGSLEYAALFGAGNEFHGKVNFAGHFPSSLNTMMTFFLTKTL